jgi:hypothetical protein
MASFVRGSLTTDTVNVDEPLNISKPIRIALLGSAKTGKTSIVSKLDQGIYTDTYYPTNRVNPSMFTFVAESEYSRSLLNSTGGLDCPPNVVLSPVLKDMKKVPSPSKRGKTAIDSNGLEVIVYNRTDFYRTYNYKDNKKGLPEVTPILVELIDTPAYKSDFIPFLESSLYTNLEKDVLRNLANEPRRHVLTMPLLVASGAGELNGSIDGYFYVYSAIPSYNPPTYHSSNTGNEENSLKVLQRIRESIDEAWKEFYTYKMKWEEGKETDIYSFKGALKNFMSNKNVDEIENKKLSKRKYYKDLLDYPTDPSDPYSPPPTWIICTHCKSHLASSNMIEEGAKLAEEWGCGYISLDISDNMVEVALSLIIRDLSERKRLQRLREANGK